LKNPPPTLIESKNGGLPAAAAAASEIRVDAKKLNSFAIDFD
jgi:hypothetical protein